MFERFTDRARRVIVLAQEEARTLQHNYIGTEHLLLGLIREGEGVAAKALASKGVTLDDTRKQVEEMIGKGNASPNGHIPFTPHARQVLELSLREALQLGHSYIGTEHILLGLIHEGEGVGTQVLIKMDVNLGELRSATIDLIRGNSSDGKNDGKGELANAGGVQDRRNQTGSAILDQFGRNLTAEAAAGKLDPVIGRSNEIERVMVVLSRRTKNNPVLIGEPGVGKTAVVEGLAQKINAGDVPETLKGKQVYSLDLGSMVAGSRYRGDFEERLKKVLKEIKTRGDIILDVPLSKVGGKGLFVKEIEEALLDGSADLAVHSIKDVPMVLPEGLVLGCVPQREICVDCLLSNRYASLDELPQGARVGTSSLRRQAQLLNLRPDLEILSLRGNVDTRLRKMKEGEYDAIVLASAGLKRLGLSADRMHHFEAASFVPAVGQGALGIECRGDDSEVLELLSRMEHRPTRICVEAERGFLAGLDGGCQVPIAGHAEMLDDERFILDGLVAEVDGSVILREQQEGTAATARETGFALARHLLDKGGKDILDRLYAENR